MGGRFLIKICLFVLMIALPCPLRAQNQSFSAWLEQTEQEAIQEGIKPDIVHQAMDGLTPNERVLACDRRQPESALSFATYSKSVLSKPRLEKGRKALAVHKSLLREVSAFYGVPASMIVALWGMESGFGSNVGSFNVIESLATLAYEGRRAKFFHDELLAALHVLDEEHKTSLQGSWAGAMGQCQFMPSTFERHAVDQDGDGRRDIWHDEADVFASIANYLASEGWQSGPTWGREVRLTRPISSEEIGLANQKALVEWNQRGVRLLSGKPLALADFSASLIQPDGPHGRSFLVYDNFRALMRWNRSTSFALTAGLFADRLNAKR